MKGLIRARPIGWVHNGIYAKPEEDWSEVVSEIEVRPELAECLDGLHEFSHIQVLFWMDRVRRRERYMKKFHPRDRLDLPLLGCFATRSQRRPNPIGLSTVCLLSLEGNRLKVKGLDALEGTPVMDIKPYAPRGEELGEIRVPAWVRRFAETRR